MAPASMPRKPDGTSMRRSWLPRRLACANERLCAFRSLYALSTSLVVDDPKLGSGLQQLDLDLLPDEVVAAGLRIQVDGRWIAGVRGNAMLAGLDEPEEGGQRRGLPPDLSVQPDGDRKSIVKVKKWPERE